MILGTFIKQPADTMDYDIDYSEWLTLNDNVESAVVTVDIDTLTVLPTVVADPVVKVWLSGGVAGVTYKLTCTMTTADGRIRQDEFKIKVKEY